MEKEQAAVKSPTLRSSPLDSVSRLPPLRWWAHAAFLRVATATAAASSVGRRSDGPVALRGGAGAAVVTEHRHRRVRARGGPPRPDAARRRQHLTALPQLLLRKGKHSS